MLKVLTLPQLLPTTATKCGEIFFKHIDDVSICCTYCQMKFFQYEEFLQHLENIHLKDFREKVAMVSNNYFELEVKPESNLYKKEENCKNWSAEKLELEQTDDSENDHGDDGNEEKLRILKKCRRKVKKKRNSKEENQSTMSSEEVDMPEKISNSPSNDTPKDVADECYSIIKNKTKDIKYSCLECNEIFALKKQLDRHVTELHNGYKCPKCDKRFGRSSHVAYHLKTHTIEKKFKCPMENCGRGFIDEDYLKRHLEVHTMERTFICEFENCGKAFQTNRRLASHQYTHRIPKKFVCDMCGHGCRSNVELITHQRVHTGEKPFPCKICSKPFKSKTALTEHMISHSETRPHVCPICKAAFANRRVLVRHGFIHSEEKTFKCKLCQSAFKHPNSLQGHMRNVHGEPKQRREKKSTTTTTEDSINLNY